MNIELTQWEVFEALEDYIKKRYGFSVGIEEQCSEYPTIAYTEAVYAPRKHKNGKVMKHEKYGYPLTEIVKREKRWLSFEECCTFVFDLERDI